MNSTSNCSISPEPKEFPAVRRVALTILAVLLALAPSVVRAGWPNIVFPSEPGITLVAGQTYAIQWESVHLNPVPIALIKWVRPDTFTVVRIISSAYPNPDPAGSISWTVPSNIPNGSSYAIQVGRLGQVVAFSDNPFTISGGGPPPPPPPPRKTAKIVVETNPSFGGTPIGTGTFEVGSQQQISATPALCFIFTGWNDGNTANPRTVTIPAGGATYTANFLNILKDSVTNIPTANSNQMGAHFVPANGNVTLEQAKQICGVHHFNWMQHITYVPKHWTVTSGLYGEGLFGAVVTPPPPLLDPIATSNKDYYYKVRSSRLSLLEAPMTFNHNDPQCSDCPVFDDQDFYLNEPVGTSGSSGRETSGSLLFSDTPMYASQYLDPNDSEDYVQFETRLVGVYSNGTSTSWNGIGTSFRWKSNTRCTEKRVVINGEVSVLGFFDSLDTNTLEAISGGVFDVSVDSPSSLATPKLQMNVNFVAGKMDQAMLTASFELPPGSTLTNRHAIVTIGGVSVDFAVDSKGKGANGLSRLKLKSRNGIGNLTATLKGDWDTNWAAAGLSNDTVKNKLVTMPVLLTFETNRPMLFGADVPLRYTATTGKTGRARYKAN